MSGSRIGHRTRRSPDIVDVVLCVDRGFEVPLAVALASLARSQASPQALRVSILVLDRALDGQAQSRLRDAAPGIAVRFFPLDGGLTAGLPDPERLSVATYGRLWAADVIPDIGERMIYLDADVVVLADLGELMSLDLGDHVAAAVRDAGFPFVSSPRGVVTWLGDPVAAVRRYAGSPFASSPPAVVNWRELGLGKDVPFFNAGVLVIDTQRWVDQEVAAKTAAYLLEHHDSNRFADQGGLNAALANRILGLPPRWNQQAALRLSAGRLPSPVSTRSIAKAMAKSAITHLCETGRLPSTATTRSIAEALARPAIMHFCGADKPWLPGCVDPGAEVWREIFRTMSYAQRNDLLA